MKNLLALTVLSFSLSAGDLVTYQQMSLELATKIAQDSLMNCRDKGYQVSAVVVDRSGNLQVALRDVYASRFTTEIAERKANAVILSGTDSGALRKNREDIRQELNHIHGLIVMEGGVPVISNGILLGAVGVSGAPGGDKDASCAEAALKNVEDRLIFAGTE
ncbi:GlcG/HbpS family heme-binding protein [Sulfuricurvum sp.]|uniref:GlcG/HbpS family heme-binding protein n=1 Tax=Sulfuricurvum sp. TaxID=2025608 RepID=UPI003BB05545